MNTNQKILLGIPFLLTAILLSVRLLVRINTPELSEIFGITYRDIAVRAILMYVCSYILLSNSIKENGFGMKVLLWYNSCIVLLFVLVNVLVLMLLFPETSVKKRVIFSSIYSHVLLLGIIQLIAAYVRANRQKLQIVIEKEQLEKEKIWIELNALKAQFNPHFLFNALNTLNALYRLAPEKAIRYNEQLSGMFRYILEKREVALVSLQEEIQFAKQYITLYKNRFGDNLNVDIQIAAEHLATKIPVFSLQVLIENAIKHNEISEEHPLQLSIKYEQRQLVVSNNLNPKQDEIVSTGLGLANLRRRFELLLKRSIRIQRDEASFSVILPLK